MSRFSVVLMLLCFTPLNDAYGADKEPRESSMVVPGTVVIDMDRTSMDSRASVLSDIPTEDILAEVIERLTTVKAVQGQEPSVAPAAATSVCFRAFLQCYQAINRIGPCAKPLIFIAGVSTILADAIAYAGGSDPQTASFVALGAMVMSVSLASIYLGCKHYYRKHLPMPP